MAMYRYCCAPRPSRHPPRPSYVPPLQEIFPYEPKGWNPFSCIVGKHFVCEMPAIAGGTTGAASPTPAPAVVVTGAPAVTVTGAPTPTPVAATAAPTVKVTPVPTGAPTPAPTLEQSTTFAPVSFVCCELFGAGHGRRRRWRRHQPQTARNRLRPQETAHNFVHPHLADTNGDGTNSSDTSPSTALYPPAPSSFSPAGRRRKARDGRTARRRR